VVKLNRVAALMVIASVSISTAAIAAESETMSLPDSTAHAVAAAPVSTTAAITRPAILPALYTTLAAVQAWDIYSTTLALKAGAKERNPISAPFAANPAALISLKLLSTASTMYFTERMWKTNRVAAVVVLAAINGATAAVSMHNVRNVRAAALR
jgi:hypothetical protein